MSRLECSRGERNPKPRVEVTSDGSRRAAAMVSEAIPLAKTLVSPEHPQSAIARRARPAARRGARQSRAAAPGNAACTQRARRRATPPRRRRCPIAERTRRRQCCTRRRDVESDAPPPQPSAAATAWGTPNVRSRLRTSSSPKVSDALSLQSPIRVGAGPEVRARVRGTCRCAGAARSSAGTGAVALASAREPPR